MNISFVVLGTVTLYKIDQIFIFSKPIPLQYQPFVVYFKSMIYPNCFMQNQHKMLNATKSSVISYKSTTSGSTSHENDGDNEIIDAIDAVAKLKLKRKRKLKQKSQKSEM